MKKTVKVLALTLGALLAASTLAACKKEGDLGEVKWAAQICYDNLPGDGISVAGTTLKVEGATQITGFKGSKKVDASTIAEYDKNTGTFTAKGPGYVKFLLEDGTTGRIDVKPAYVTDPGEDWHYTGDKSKDTNEENSVLLGSTHDPSLIQVEENGQPVYYMVSTGWETQTTDEDGLKTWGNPIRRSYDLLTWEYLGRTFDHANWTEEFKNQEIWNWLYNGTHTGYGDQDAGWWAPDIVPCPSGGYWLYTCIVDGAGDSQGMSAPGGVYARAACLLYHADKIEAGAFKPVTYPEGHVDAGKQVVLMQSSIRRGEDPGGNGIKDVNGIDPQIIYTPDGKMYMAYGSFGSGNYIIELDPATGLRKDGKGWQTHDDIRNWVENDIQSEYGSNNTQTVGWEHDYYGKNISKGNMEAPVIARHDNVVISDENGVKEQAKTYYYSMHSYNGLSDDYQMWGGRSENVTGIYKSAGGEGIVHNVHSTSGSNQGNKYMGAFKWHTKSAGNNEIDVILTGHNDLFTTMSGTSVAAYITRTPSYGAAGAGGTFLVQLHQYYLNSLGDLVISPNRYAGEVNRAVSKEELFAYTDGGKFKMVVMANHRDTAGTGSDLATIKNVSRDVVLTEDGKIKEGNNEIGTWLMYGEGYIKFTFNSTIKTWNGSAYGTDSGETVYYGVVRPAWLGDQNKSGFTITMMGHSSTTRSMPLYLNNYSTIEGSGLVGE